MTVRPLAVFSETVKSMFSVPVSPSVMVASAMEMVGGASLSVFVPVAGPPLSVTFDPVVVKKAFLKWRRDAAERGARDEVRRDLEAYLRARAESEK